jgi:hypothetical protein
MISTALSLTVDTQRGISLLPQGFFSDAHTIVCLAARKLSSTQLWLDVDIAKSNIHSCLYETCMLEALLNGAIVLFLNML